MRKQTRKKTRRRKMRRGRGREGYSVVLFVNGVDFRFVFGLGDEHFLREGQHRVVATERRREEKRKREKSGREAEQER
jgi:hypothetical protein